MTTSTVAIVMVIIAGSDLTYKHDLFACTEILGSLVA